MDAARLLFPEAQARLNPPRIDLARLTVSQYRNAVADLSTSFRWQQTPGEERGLNAAYFAGRSHRRERQVLQRLDPQINFQFGTASPDGEKLSEDAFAISWDGSLIPRETGWYDFTLRTENGARLYINDRRHTFDRRVGPFRNRHRLSRPPLPALRAPLPSQAGMVQVQRKDRDGTALMESSWRRVRTNSPATPLPQIIPRRACG
ncbi:MAG UNVERIFIED_CONTAM: PA14 domain-containing protein [Planctomycetaceae bacterium]|jgi:hypothetical protein